MRFIIFARHTRLLRHTFSLTSLLFRARALMMIFFAAYAMPPMLMMLILRQFCAPEQRQRRIRSS